jgi:hypothetical protein
MRIVTHHALPLASRSRTGFSQERRAQSSRPNNLRRRREPMPGGTAWARTNAHRSVPGPERPRRAGYALAAKEARARARAALSASTSGTGRVQKSIRAATLRGQASQGLGRLRSVLGPVTGRKASDEAAYHRHGGFKGRGRSPGSSANWSPATGGRFASRRLRPGLASVTCHVLASVSASLCERAFPASRCAATSRPPATRTSMAQMD